MLDDLAQRILDSYDSDPRLSHIDAEFLPSRARCIEIVELMRRIIFPGFFDDTKLTRSNVRVHVHKLLADATELLNEQVHQAMCYDEARAEKVGQHPGHAQTEPAHDPVAVPNSPVSCTETQRRERAARITREVLDEVPRLRRLIGTDVQAAFDGDPASDCTDETIFCYPGVDAIFTHRIAHELWLRKVPLLARIISEYAHNETGIDIHPGAAIDESFFIDHGTGVVVGETCRIGKHVKLYQGVTLGAMSTKGGQHWRGRQRHPVIEDDVTIYGGTIILGGDTVIGRGSTIGGSLFITGSIPANHTVTLAESNLKIKPNKKPLPTPEPNPVTV